MIEFVDNRSQRRANNRPPAHFFVPYFSSLQVLNHPNATSAQWEPNASRDVADVDAAADDTKAANVSSSRETNDNFICISDLESRQAPDDELINGVPDHQFVLGFKTLAIPDDVLFNNEGRYYHYYSE